MKASRARVSAFEVPTSAPEADGTLAWNSTVLVTTEITFGAVTGFGYTYASTSTAHLIHDHLAKIALTADVMAPQTTFSRMEVAVRNLGRGGVAAMGIAAVDMALWDAKAKLHGRSLVDAIGARRDEILAYGSGGFTSYSQEELSRALAIYKEQGFSRVKMKIGDDPKTLARVRAARHAVGDGIELFVDANGAYTPKRALDVARRMEEHGVRWFEEPVSSDDLEGLRFVRERCPASMDIAAGEYGYTHRYFDGMLAAGAVDVLQADATRCGVTGFLAAAESCDARGIRLSAHCGPSIHAHLGCAAPRVVHVEYFHDHARIEGMLFEGVISPKSGTLTPNRSSPGLGIALKRADAKRYQTFDAELHAEAA